MTYDSQHEELGLIWSGRQLTTPPASLDVAPEAGRTAEIIVEMEVIGPDRLRASIATIALPDEAELKKLARYRSMLELSLGRRLTALKQLRKLTAGNVAGEKDCERAKEFRVRLRVVA